MVDDAVKLDDHPEGNYFERRALEDLGIPPYCVTDPEQAIKALSEKQFDAAVLVPEHIVSADSWKTLEGQLQKKNISVVVYDLVPADHPVYSVDFDFCFAEPEKAKIQLLLPRYLIRWNFKAADLSCHFFRDSNSAFQD